MIISRTPFRISFFGGGTDYPEWYKEHGGAVISTTINKFCYINCRELPPFFDYKYRLRYFLKEETKSISEIQHPSIRECMEFMEIDHGVEIVHTGDVPARSGLGSSSTFTVGLLNALFALKHRMPTKRELALNALHVEQERIGESVGSQDQTAAAFGGINRIEFGGPQEISVHPMMINPEKLQHFEDFLMLFFTGFSRTASEIASEQIKRIGDKISYLKTMMEMVEEVAGLLQNGEDSLGEIGRILNEQWRIKRELSPLVTNSNIDNIYDTGMRAGAIGGKLLGAGGGGCILFMAKPEDQPKIIEALGGILHIPFRFDHLGSQIIYYSHENHH